MSLYSHLKEDLGYDKATISSFALSAPKKYKTYQIPKRTSGTRLIAHPSKELKKYQRSLIKLLSKKLPVHSKAVAYVEKKGIRYNANLHRKSKYLLKMDFHNFFHSITPEMLSELINQPEIELNIESLEFYLLKNLLFWSPSKKSTGKLVLSIGAPSSPYISNTILYKFDQAIENHCKENGVIYSRYADDITFSTNKKLELFKIPRIVKKALREQFKGAIKINESKTVFSSKAHNRHITGVTITNEGSLSLGRERKRMISALIHQYKINKLPESDLSYLVGLLSFAKDIEPTFLSRMEKKYSASTLVSLRKKAGEIRLNKNEK